MGARKTIATDSGTGMRWNASPIPSVDIARQELRSSTSPVRSVFSRRVPMRGSSTAIISSN